MSVGIKINDAEFAKVLELAIKHSERTYDAFLNGQGLALASRAMRHTDVSDASRIATQLGQVASRVTNRNGGKLRKARRVFSSESSIDLYRIVNWTRKRRGKRPLGGKEMSGPARKVRAGRLRSSGFIKSGWVYAIKELARKVGYADYRDSRVPKISGKSKGYAIPAKPSISSVVTCEIANTSLLGVSGERTGSKIGNPLPIGMRALRAAYSETQRDILDHLVKKLGPVFSQFSAK